jgi:hypothetical protein
MLGYYKRTFVRMQIAIWVVATVMVFVTRQFVVGAAFAATMQIGALLGAILGARLNRLSRRA